MLNEYKKLLSKYISFKSISTDPTFKKEIEAQAIWLVDYCKSFGAKTELWKGIEANPVVFANLVIDKKLPTVLVYGHYDVQPAEWSDGWSSDPFVLTEKSGRLIARGVVDNKGQNLIHLFTVAGLANNGLLKCNVKFLIEGNEETGNPEIAQIVKKYKDKLVCDTLMISDGEIVGFTPTIEATLRGGFNMTVRLATGLNNLHSGLYGGAVPSASREMLKLLNTLFDSKGPIAVKDFYKDIPIVSKNQMIKNSKISTVSKILKTAGVKQIVSDTGIDFFTQTGMKPTIQVTGISSGYNGAGYSNIVPANAEARINVRLVGKQNPQKVYKLICDHLRSKTPKYASIFFSHGDFNEPVVVDVESKEAQEVRKILHSVFKKEAIIKNVGGSIPIVSDFKNVLKKETLLISLGNDDCNMHGVDENFNLYHVEKGLEFSRKFFSK